MRDPYRGGRLDRAFLERDGLRDLIRPRQSPVVGRRRDGEEKRHMRRAEIECLCGGAERPRRFAAMDVDLRHPDVADDTALRIVERVGDAQPLLDNRRGFAKFSQFD